MEKRSSHRAFLLLFYLNYRSLGSMNWAFERRVGRGETFAGVFSTPETTFLLLREEDCIFFSMEFFEEAPDATGELWSKVPGFGNSTTSVEMKEREESFSA